MLKFIAPSNYKGNPGQILTCKGNIFVTKVENKQVVLCSNITTSIQEIAYRAALPIGFLPIGAQNNMYSSASTNTDRTKTWMYATEPESIGGLIYNGQIVSTSKTEPLVLYYLFDGNQLSLSLYNIQARVTTPIISLATNTTLGIEKCQFIIGGFTSSKQQDIFASCGVFNVTNAFFNQADQYIASDAGLGNWCSSNSASNNLNSIIMVGDFNGDLLSDLFCTATRHAMINKLGSFREILLVKQTPGNWAAQFINQYNQQNIAIGDLDGNGLSDFVSLTSSANPEILFNNKLNNFINYPGNKNSDGSFTINSVNKWCGSNSNAELVIIDADNDGKDDLLCKNNDLTSSQYGQVYLSLSRTDPYVASSNQTLQKVIVILEDFVIGDNIGYFISDKNAPLFCDASRLFEYHTKVRCALNSPNKVEGFTNPVRLSNAIPSTEVRSHVKGSIYLGDADRYGELNLESKEVYNEIPRSRFQFPKAKTWGLESKNFIDPSRSFDSKITTQFIRQGRVKDKKYHAIDQVYGHSVHGGDCNEVNFNFITLTNYFTASGRIEAYDQNNNKILDANLLNDLANIYVLAGNTTTPLGTNTTITINKIAGGAVSFSFNGEIELQTLYQKNVTHCSIKGITQSDITDNQVVPAGSAASTSSDDQSALCAFEMDPEQQYTNTTISGSTRSPSLLTRADILELGGIIYAGAAFFPDVIKNATKAGNLGIDRYSTNIDDTTCKLNYNNSISLNAYLRNGGEYFAQAPHNELMIDFRQNGKVIYEPTRIRFANGTVSSTAAALYAGFDNIKQIKLAAFDATHILLAWTIYIAEEKQYYALIDYANTGGNILRIPLYDKDFNIVIANQRFGNEFYVSYRSSPDKLVISRYSAESFALSRSVEVGISDVSENTNGNSDFILQVEEIPASGSNDQTSNLVLIRSHNDNKGLFIKKFDIFLNEIGSETNIICDDSSQDTAATVPTKADDGYDVLRLNYQHNSKVVYHSNDTTYNLNKKISLQNGLNLLYRGLSHLQSLISNQDANTQSQVESSLEGLICEPVLSYKYLSLSAEKTQSLLRSGLTYEIHTATSNPNCKADSYYPVYRVGANVHLCANFDVLSSMNECSRFVALAQTTKNLMSSTSFVDSNVLASLLAYFPSDVVSSYTEIINSASLANNAAGICDTGSVYNLPINQQTSQQSNNYANNIANNLVAGLISPDLPKARVKLSVDYNGCFGMVQRGCAASYEKANNILCVSYFFEAASTASIIAEAASSNIEVKYNCATGCDLDNPALAKLASALGGYVTTKVEGTFIPKDYSYVLARFGQVQTQDNSGSTNNADNSFASSNTKILTAAPTYFYDEGASLIAFAYLGNDYIDLKAQYYLLNSTTTLGSEQFLGRFLNVRQIQTVAFNETNVLIGYSVKHPTQNAYNILIQYITPTITKVLNVYPSYNGVFALDTVPTATTTTNSATNAAASTEFMVSYPSSSTELTTKRYKIEKTGITEMLKVTDAVAAIPDTVANNPNVTVPSLFVNAFTDNTFNVIWSNLDQTGIKVQRHNQQSGNTIGNAETITGSDNAEAFPQTLKVGAGDAGNTIVSWQNLDQVYFSMINQTPVQAGGQQQATYSTLNFAANNYTLQDAKIVDEVKDIISVTLKDLSNNLKTILADAGSSKLSFADILDITAGQLSLGTNTTSNIKSSASSAIGSIASGNYLFSELLGSINKNLNINSNAQQCPSRDGFTNTNTGNRNSNGNTANNNNINDLLNSLNIQDILSQAGDMLQNKGTLVDQIQSALNIPRVKESLDKLGVKEDVIYSMVDKLSSIGDLQDYIKNNLNKFKDLDLSQIPDTDVTAQIKTGQDFATAIANAFANNTSSGQGREFKAEDVTDILSILSKIPLPTDLSEDGVIEFLDGVFKNVMVELIRTFLQLIFNELKELSQQREFVAEQSVTNCIILILIGVVLLITGIGIVVYKIQSYITCKMVLENRIIGPPTQEEQTKIDQCTRQVARIGVITGLRILVALGTFGLGIGAVIVGADQCQADSPTPLPTAPVPVTLVPAPTNSSNSSNATNATVLTTPTPATPSPATQTPATAKPMEALCISTQFLTDDMEYKHNIYISPYNNNSILRTAYNFLAYENYVISDTKVLTLSNYSILIMNVQILGSDNSTIVLQYLNNSLVNTSSSFILFEHPYIQQTKITKFREEGYVIGISFTPVYAASSGMLVFFGNITDAVYQVDILPIQLYYNGAFDIISMNDLYITYASSMTTITVQQYINVNYTIPIDNINICSDYELNLKMDTINLQSLLVSWTHYNQKGIFLKTIHMSLDSKGEYYNIAAYPTVYFLGTNENKFSVAWQEVQSETNTISIVFFNNNRISKNNTLMSVNITGKLYNYYMLSSNLSYLSYSSGIKFIEEVRFINQTLLGTLSTDITKHNQITIQILQEYNQTYAANTSYKSIISAIPEKTNVTIAKSLIRWNKNNDTYSFTEDQFEGTFSNELLTNSTYVAEVISEALPAPIFDYLKIGSIEILDKPNYTYNSIAWALGIKNLWINLPRKIEDFQALFMQGCRLEIKEINLTFSTSYCYVNHPIDAINPTVKGWGVSYRDMHHASRYIKDGISTQGIWTSKLGHSFLITHDSDVLLDFSYNSSIGVVLTAFIEKVSFDYKAIQQNQLSDILYNVYNKSHFTNNNMLHIKHSVNAINQSIQLSFNNSYQLWFNSCLKQKALSSNTYDCSEISEFSVLTTLNSTIIPMLINLLVDPNNFHALVPYEAIQTNNSYHIPAIAEDRSWFECEQSRAIKTVALWLQNEGFND